MIPQIGLFKITWSSVISHWKVVLISGGSEVSWKLMKCHAFSRHLKMKAREQRASLWQGVTYRQGHLRAACCMNNDIGGKITNAQACASQSLGLLKRTGFTPLTLFYFSLHPTAMHFHVSYWRKPRRAHQTLRSYTFWIGIYRKQMPSVLCVHMADETASNMWS